MSLKPKNCMDRVPNIEFENSLSIAKNPRTISRPTLTGQSGMGELLEEREMNPRNFDIASSTWLRKSENPLNP